jgi:hypothetical protein
MDARVKVPPVAKGKLSKPEKLAEKLSCLIGENFSLTGKSRTDGSNIRKLVAKTLVANTPPDGAPKNSFEVIPP